MRQLFGCALLMSLPLTAQPATVTFTIDMKEPIAKGWFDPATETVGVRGAQAPLNWEETLAATRVGEGTLYRVTVTFPERPYGGQPVAYKFKADGKDNPDNGWEKDRNRLLSLSGATQTVERAFDAPVPPYPVTFSGTVRVHKDFQSKFLAPREVQVWLPPGYDKEPERRYPVLYMHDGQNVFDSSQMGMEWQVDETAGRLVEAGAIEPLIVVAVASTEARTDEYRPYVHEYEEDGRKFKEGGKTGLYARLLLEELKPFIDRTYRTLTDASHTGVGGASYGGLVSLWLGLHYPDVFGKLIVSSASARWGDGAILREISALPGKKGLKIWEDVGTNEGEDLLLGAREIRDALAAKGWKEGVDLQYLEQKGGTHSETAWASRVEGMLRFLFPKPAAVPK
ncbi:MAG TPA: alpha/beta hydrolase-fold protein [Thermoanaerobaculia bacterium]|nr:alpha/beta hydrolase-fold protein [Thermoanaerobaculia bacterium]